MEETQVRYRVTNSKGIYKKSDFEMEEEIKQNKRISLDAELPIYQICPTIIRAYDGQALDTWGLSLDEVIDFCVKQKNTDLLNYLQPDYSDSIDKPDNLKWNLYTTHVNQCVKDYKSLLHYINKFNDLKEKSTTKDDKKIISLIEKEFFKSCDKQGLLSNVKFIMKEKNVDLQKAIKMLANFDRHREENYLKEEKMYVYLLNDTLNREAYKAKNLSNEQKEIKRNFYLEKYFFHLNAVKLSSINTYDWTLANLNLKRFLMYSNKNKSYLQEKMLRGKLLSKRDYEHINDNNSKKDTSDEKFEK